MNIVNGILRIGKFAVNTGLTVIIIAGVAVGAAAALKPQDKELDQVFKNFINKIIHKNNINPSSSSMKNAFLARVGKAAANTAAPLLFNKPIIDDFVVFKIATYNAIQGNDSIRFLGILNSWIDINNM